MRYPLSLVAVTCSVVVASAGVLPRPALAADSVPPSYQIAQNNQGPNLFNLFQQIQQLQEQVRDLQGQVDTLKYQEKQNEQGQRELYQNLDKRLGALESGGAAGAAGQNGSGDAAGNDDGSDANVPPEVQSAYMDGFNKLKAGQYDAAIAAFGSFVAQNPETSLTDNAWYWLGEANYVQQNLGASQKAFEMVVNRFANSAKVPAALFKIGLIQASQNQNSAAKVTWQKLISQYPNSDSATQAKQKLQSLGG